jgi:hypothetical protein
MWMTIITTAFKVIGWMMDRSKIKAEQKKEFLEFYERWKKDSNQAIDHKKDIDAQL